MCRPNHGLNPVLGSLPYAAECTVISPSTPPAPWHQPWLVYFSCSAGEDCKSLKASKRRQPRSHCHVSKFVEDGSTILDQDGEVHARWTSNCEQAGVDAPRSSWRWRLEAKIIRKQPRSVSSASRLILTGVLPSWIIPYHFFLCNIPKHHVALG